MTMTSWHGQNAILSIEDSEGNPISIGVLQDVEVSTDREIKELRGSGSIKRQDIMQTEISIKVTGTIAEWDLDAYKTLIAYSESPGKIEDSSSPSTFTVDVDVEPSDSSTAETIQVKEVYFDSLPIRGSREEFLNIDLDGNGKDIEINPA